MTINYDGRVFASVANSANGEVGRETRFHYRQDRDLVWADYRGGAVRRGHLLGTAAADGTLTFTYHHVNAEGHLMTGRCRSTVTILDDGRYRLNEDWQWTSGDRSRGQSVVEELVS